MVYIPGERFFIRKIAINRKDTVVKSWRILQDPLSHPYKWLRPDILPVPPSSFLLHFFFQCQAALAPGRSVVLADPGRNVVKLGSLILSC